jgi:hypothetical protein
MDVKTNVTENALDLRNIAADLRITAWNDNFPPGLRFGILAAAREAESAGLSLEAIAATMAETP